MLAAAVLNVLPVLTVLDVFQQKEDTEDAEDNEDTEDEHAMRAQPLMSRPGRIAWPTFVAGKSACATLNARTDGPQRGAGILACLGRAVTP